MVDPSSGAIPDRKLAKARRASKKQQPRGGGEGQGGEENNDAGAGGDPAVDRSLRPPISCSGSSGIRQAGTPARTRVRGNRGGAVPQGAGLGAGARRGEAADSDCDTIGAAEEGEGMDVGAGAGARGREEGTGGRASRPSAEDSDGGSRFHASSGDEHLDPRAAGGSREAGAPEGREGRMPAPSPLTMVHHRGGRGATS